MPCYDPRAEEESRREQDDEHKKMEAILCAIFTKHSLTVLNGVDWTEAGVNRLDALDWWRKHQEKDRRRKAMEKKAEQIIRQKEEAEYLRLKKKLGKG